jgi:hypothetical protein
VQVKLVDQKGALLDFFPEMESDCVTCFPTTLPPLLILAFRRGPFFPTDPRRCRSTLKCLVRTQHVSTASLEVATAMNAVRDGGPPGWALVGELQSAPGLDRLSHCRLAATTFMYIGYRLRKAGRLQHYKLQGIL